MLMFSKLFSKSLEISVIESNTIIFIKTPFIENVIN